ncbi:MAG: hypothetical protein ABIK09_15215 [Pseudomonadota bacterium]
MRTGSIILLLLVVCAGVSCRDRVPDSPAEAARLALRSLQRGAPLPVYRALPEAWRRNVQAVVTRAIGAVEPGTWDELGVGLGLFADGIRRHPEAALTLPLPIRSEEDRVRVLQILVALEEHLDDAGLLRHETARALDVERFLGDPGEELLPLLMELADRTRPCPAWNEAHDVLRAMAALRRDAGAALVEDDEAFADSGEATVAIGLGDLRHEVPFVQVDGRWVPRSMATAWDPGVEAVGSALDRWIVRWTENREAARVRVEAFRAAAEHFSKTGETRALLTTLPPL